MKEEKSYGIITVLRGEEDRFLILKHLDGHYGVPKGHKENKETDRETALRELEEETEIKEIKLLNIPTISEEYLYERDGKKYHKTNKYYIGLVQSDEVVIQREEIIEYKWMTVKEILVTIKYESAKNIFEKIENYLKDYKI